MADMMYGSAAAGGDLSEDMNSDFYTGMNNNQNRPRFPGLYIGNLTWWTTDQDVINNIIGIGVNDVQEVKFFENRNNGQSKGFCVVTFGSEASLPIVMEKLPKIELHGQNPVVTPYNRQNLNLFESQTKTRPQMNNSNNNSTNQNNGPATGQHPAGIMGISLISGVHANTQGLPYSAGATSMNNYNSQGSGVGVIGGGPRPPYHQNMRMPMRAPRPGFAPRGPMPPITAMNNGPMIPGGGGGGGAGIGHQMNSNPMMQGGHQMNNNPMIPGGHQINNGPMIPGGHQMTRMPRFMQPQTWRDEPRRDDIRRDDIRREDSWRDELRTRDEPPTRRDDLRRDDLIRRDELRRDDVRRDDIRRDDLRRDDIRRDDVVRRDDIRRDEPRRGGDDSRRSGDETRRDDARRGEESRRDERSSSRRDKESSSSRREKESSSSFRRDKESSSSSSSRRDKSHRSDERARSRSRDRTSRERRERRDRY